MKTIILGLSVIGFSLAGDVPKTIPIDKYEDFNQVVLSVVITQRDTAKATIDQLKAEQVFRDYILKLKKDLNLDPACEIAPNKIITCPSTTTPSPK